MIIYAACKLYVDANSLSDLRILHMIIAAHTRTAIKPGTNAVPREPVVISVPVSYTQLDVYKRQAQRNGPRGMADFLVILRVASITAQKMPESHIAIAKAAKFRSQPSTVPATAVSLSLIHI